MTSGDGELTEHELEIVCLVVAGYSNKDLARKLGITVRGAKIHLTRIFDKVGASDRFELALLALHRGMIHHSA